MDQIGVNILGEIKNKLPQSKDLAVVLADSLHLSKSAAYRKISGEVPLTLSEAAILAQRFSISLDTQILGSTKATGLMFEPLQRKAEILDTDIDYYTRMLKVVERTYRYDPAMVLCIASQELNVFHYVNFPELAAFQIMIWSKATMRWKTIEDDTFRIEAQAHNPELTAVTTQLIDLYAKIESVEFISEGLLDKNLNAIQQYAQQPVFSDPHTPLLLCEQLESMIKLVFSMAKTGKKINSKNELSQSSSNYTLYFDVMPNYWSNICFLSEIAPLAFIVMDFPNFMTTQSPVMMQYLDKWIKNCKANSNRISGESEMFRMQVMHNYLNKIKQVKRMLMR